jgi:hypothetical protein
MREPGLPRLSLELTELRTRARDEGWNQARVEWRRKRNEENWKPSLKKPHKSEAQVDRITRPNLYQEILTLGVKRRILRLVEDLPVPVLAWNHAPSPQGPAMKITPLCPHRCRWFALAPHRPESPPSWPHFSESSVLVHRPPALCASQRAAPPQPLGTPSGPRCRQDLL